MTREEFEKWIEQNNFKTIYSLKRKYRYLNTNKFDFNLVCVQGHDGMFGCFKEDTVWELIAYEPWTGDRPKIYYTLSSNDKFDKEEEALEELKNKLIEHFSEYNKCNICHSSFSIDTREIPSNQKTFYYMCPNCNAELKFGNPNYKEEVANRELLLKTMEIPNNIRKLSKEEQNEVVLKYIVKTNEILKNVHCYNAEYELSVRQQCTKNNALNDMNVGSFLDAYYEIIDFVDNYGDDHDGKIFEIEKQEIYNLIAMLYKKINM